MFKKAVQRGRSERKVEAYSSPDVETLSEMRTKLAGFFNVPLSRSGGMADTPASGAGARKGVRVQLPASAPQHLPLSYQESSSLTPLQTLGWAEWLCNCEVNRHFSAL
jgi:hypothetical protein